MAGTIRATQGPVVMRETMVTNNVGTPAATSQTAAPAQTQTQTEQFVPSGATPPPTQTATPTDFDLLPGQIAPSTTTATTAAPPPPTNLTMNPDGSVNNGVPSWASAPQGGGGWVPPGLPGANGPGAGGPGGPGGPTFPPGGPMPGGPMPGNGGGFMASIMNNPFARMMLGQVQFGMGSMAQGMGLGPLRAQGLYANFVQQCNMPWQGGGGVPQMGYAGATGYPTAGANIYGGSPGANNSAMLAQQYQNATSPVVPHGPVSTIQDFGAGRNIQGYQSLASQAAAGGSFDGTPITAKSTFGQDYAAQQTSQQATMQAAQWAVQARQSDPRVDQVLTALEQRMGNNTGFQSGSLPDLMARRDLIQSAFSNGTLQQGTQFAQTFGMFSQSLDMQARIQGNMGNKWPQLQGQSGPVPQNLQPYYAHSPFNPATAPPAPTAAPPAAAKPTTVGGS